MCNEAFRQALAKAVSREARYFAMPIAFITAPNSVFDFAANVPNYAAPI